MHVTVCSACCRIKTGNKVQICAHKLQQELRNKQGHWTRTCSMTLRKTSECETQPRRVAPHFALTCRATSTQVRWLCRHMTPMHRRNLAASTVRGDNRWCSRCAQCLPVLALRCKACLRACVCAFYSSTEASVLAQRDTAQIGDKRAEPAYMCTLHVRLVSLRKANATQHHRSA